MKNRIFNVGHYYHYHHYYFYCYLYTLIHYTIHFSTNISVLDLYRGGDEKRELEARGGEDTLWGIPGTGKENNTRDVARYIP